MEEDVTGFVDLARAALAEFVEDFVMEMVRCSMATPSRRAAYLAALGRKFSSTQVSPRVASPFAV